MKIVVTILGQLWKGVSQLLQNCKDRPSEQTYARTITENEKVNIKVYVCSLSLSLSLSHTALFISVQWWTLYSLTQCSVVVNKFFYKRTKIEFLCVYDFFSQQSYNRGLTYTYSIVLHA